MRNLVINTLNLSCYLFLIIWIIIGFVLPMIFIPNQSGMIIIGVIIGFIIGSISVGIIFILMDIRNSLIKIEMNFKKIKSKSE